MGFRIELSVADLDASIRFYEAALGFALERRDPGDARPELAFPRRLGEACP